jgi:hypothetical protein
VKYVSLLISLLALFVSGLSFYFSSLRTVDDLSVSAINPALVYRRGNNAISVVEFEDKPLQLVLMNAGNRPIAILAVEIVVRETAIAKPIDCQSGDDVSFPTDFSPTIIEKNQVIIKDVRIARAPDSTGLYKRRAYEVLLPHDDGEDLLHVCAKVTLSTPDLASYETSVQLASYVSTLAMRSDRYDKEGRPQTLLKQRGISF